MDDEELNRHLQAALGRAATCRAEAAALNAAGHHSAALVWTVRAAEILLRDFVLTPHFLESGLPWERATRKGSNVLGASNWDRAFFKAEEWFGPFDTPLTETGEHAWSAWRRVVSRRGDLVHGIAVVEATPGEVADALAFAERMATWYAQRFVVSSRHPANRIFRAALAQAAEAARRDSASDQ